MMHGHTYIKESLFVKLIVTCTVTTVLKLIDLLSVEFCR